MSCRVACQPELRRHWPIFSPPDLPPGLAECLVCRDWITAVDLLEGVCQLPILIPAVPVAIEPADLPDGLAEPPVKHKVQLNGMRSGDMPTERRRKGCPVASPITAFPNPDGDRLTDGSPVRVAPTSADARDAERERTLGMIRRCAEHQW